MRVDIRTEKGEGKEIFSIEPYVVDRRKT